MLEIVTLRPKCYSREACHTQPMNEAAHSLKDLTVVEYSPSQKCLHVESALEMLQCNRRVFMGLSMTDYLPIGLFSDQGSLERFLEAAHKALAEGLDPPQKHFKTLHKEANIAT